MNITDDMTWREKYKTYKETQNEAPQTSTVETESQMEKSDLDLAMANENIEELFNKEKFLDDDSFETEVLDDNFNEEVYVADSFDEIETFIEALNLDEEISLEEIFGSEESYYEQAEEIRRDAETTSNLIKSEYVIDPKKGFYLVDFDDTTSLVGHINDEIFVLKRFDEKISGKIQARLDERKDNATNYMTKVGNFRGLVEVKPDNMNLLIEL